MASECAIYALPISNCSHRDANPIFCDTDLHALTDEVALVRGRWQNMILFAKPMILKLPP